MRHGDVLRAHVIFTFFFKTSVVALKYLLTYRTDMNIALLLTVSSFNKV